MVPRTIIQLGLSPMKMIARTAANIGDVATRGVARAAPMMSTEVKFINRPTGYCTTPNRKSQNSATRGRVRKAEGSKTSARIAVMIKLATSEIAVPVDEFTPCKPIRVKVPKDPNPRAATSPSRTARIYLLTPRSTAERSIRRLKSLPTIRASPQNPQAVGFMSLNWVPISCGPALCPGPGGELPVSPLGPQLVKLYDYSIGISDLRCDAQGSEYAHGSPIGLGLQRGSHDLYTRRAQFLV